MALLVAPDIARSWRPRGAGRVAGASRVAAALTVLAFVVSNLLALRHEATTRHVRCAEHGEMMHGEAPLAARRTVEAAGQERAGRHSLLRGAGAATIHGHEHCALTSTTRDSRVDLRPPAIALAQIAISEIPAAAPRAANAHRDGLYRTAPKTSPPA
ncbi:MAG TPA: hypothetical protein VFT22_36060 [Kofleriaceae bacterium]|nr:hypothetical protein [Kofleriaceae bacterium]